MRKHQVTIRHARDEVRLMLRHGLGFQALGANQGVPLEFDCRQADCGICIFKVVEGRENISEAGAEEKAFLRAMHADDDERLACQCRVFGDVVIESEDFS